MAVIDRIAAAAAELTAWRHHIHAHPETAFQERQTADFVAERLQSFGIQVHRGLAKTGVVGTLKAGSGNRAIGLRADMDALDLDDRAKASILGPRLYRELRKRRSNHHR